MNQTYSEDSGGRVATQYRQVSTPTPAANTRRPPMTAAINIRSLPSSWLILVAVWIVVVVVDSAPLVPSPGTRTSTEVLTAIVVVVVAARLVVGVVRRVVVVWRAAVVVGAGTVVVVVVAVVEVGAVVGVVVELVSVVGGTPAPAGPTKPSASANATPSPETTRSSGLLRARFSLLLNAPAPSRRKCQATGRPSPVTATTHQH